MSIHFYDQPERMAGKAMPINARKREMNAMKKPIIILGVFILMTKQTT